MKAPLKHLLIQAAAFLAALALNALIYALLAVVLHYPEALLLLPLLAILLLEVRHVTNR